MDAQEITQLIARAGLDTSWLNLESAPRNMWQAALDGLHHRRKVGILLLQGVTPQIPAREKERSRAIALRKGYPELSGSPLPNPGPL